MYFYVNSKGVVKMRSASQIKTNGNFRELVYTPSAEEWEKINQNYRMKEKNGTISYEKTPKQKEAEKRTAIDDLKAKASLGLPVSSTEILNLL